MVGFKISGYEYLKGVSNYVVKSPNKHMELFKNPVEAKRYLQNCIDREIETRCDIIITADGYDRLTGEKSK